MRPLAMPEAGAVHAINGAALSMMPKGAVTVRRGGTAASVRKGICPGLHARSLSGSSRNAMVRPRLNTLSDAGKVRVLQISPFGLPSPSGDPSAGTR